MGMQGTNRDYDENWILNARKGVWSEKQLLVKLQVKSLECEC